MTSPESGESFHEEGKERQPRFKLAARIAISGLGGTGKTAFIKELGELCGLDTSENSFFVIKIGERVRKWNEGKTGEQQLAFIPRTKDDDRRIDDFQRHFLEFADPNYNCIIESRLAGVWAREIKKQAAEEGKKIHQIISILLTADEPTRFARVWKRDSKIKKDLTREQSDKNALAKIVGDQANFFKAHPDIMAEIKGNPLDPELAKLYDIHIDTNGLSRNQVLKIAIEELVKRGALIEIAKKNKGEAFSKSGNIYPNKPNVL